MAGREADLKILSLSIHHWDFIKESNCLSVWDEQKKTFYDDSEGLIKELRRPFAAPHWRYWGERQQGVYESLKIPSVAHWKSSSS